MATSHFLVPNFWYCNMNKELKNKNRKYSLIDNGVYTWQENAKKDNLGFCVMKFKADFVIEDLMNNYSLNDEIELNGEICHITEVGKRCFGEECALFKKNKLPCPLKNGVMFAG